MCPPPPLVGIGLRCICMHAYMHIPHTDTETHTHTDAHSGNTDMKTYLFNTNQNWKNVPTCPCNSTKCGHIQEIENEENGFVLE